MAIKFLNLWNQFLNYFKIPDPDILRIIEEENNRNSWNVAVIRLIAAVVWLSLSLVLGYGYQYSDWAVSVPWLVAYLFLSILLIRSLNAKSRMHWLVAWTTPFLDMPIIFISIYLSLNTAPYPIVGAMVAMCFFLLFIIPSTSIIHPVSAFISLVEAWFFTVILLDIAGVEFPNWSPTVLMIYIMGGIIAFNISRRPLIVARQYSKAKEESNQLARYFSPQVSDYILSHRSEMEDKNPEVTVLFSDIRGFTKFSDENSGELVLDLLNEYLGKMVDVIFQYGGTLDKFMGDGILAYFGAPIKDEAHSVNAIRCALRMQEEIVLWNTDLRKRNLPNFQIGIGLNSGKVIMGDVGPLSRKEFTIIGDTVNTASRIETLTKELKENILVSESTFILAKERFQWKEFEPREVKGKNFMIKTYTPQDI